MRLLEPARVAAATRVASAATSDIVTGSIAPSGASPAHLSQPAPDKSIDPRTGKPKGPLSLLRDEVLRAAPVSILVSRADARVYVRHMFEPVIEAEIAIAEARRPIGTHVYTLTGMQPDGSEQRWSAVSVKLAPRRLAAVRVLAGSRSRAARAIDPRAGARVPDEGSPSTAAEAVERFTLPPDVAGGDSAAAADRSVADRHRSAAKQARPHRLDRRDRDAVGSGVAVPARVTVHRAGNVRRTSSPPCAAWPSSTCPP